MRSLGATDLAVTPIGLGLAALGRPGYINLGHADDLGRRFDVAAMQAQAHGVLDAAWAAGIRYFDAARSYGRGEAFLASWIAERGLTPDELTCGSKWGYTYTAQWRVDAEVHEVKDHSRPVLDRQWKESSALLGRFLKLYQIHSATLASGVLDNAPVLSGLARIKADGVAIGLTTSGTDQPETLREALGITIDGVPLFDCVQATWNLLEPSAGSALAEAHARGWGVIVKEALANGRLTERNREPGFAPRMALLQRHATRLQTTVDALALAAVLARPWAHVVLSGAATPAQLATNLGARAVVCDAGVEQELSLVVEEPGVYWGTRGALAWN